jgi:hypothetical protein
MSLSLLSSIAQKYEYSTLTGVLSPSNTNMWLQFENNTINSGTKSVAPTATLINTGKNDASYNSTIVKYGSYSLSVPANSESYVTAPNIQFSQTNGATFSLWFYYVPFKTTYVYLFGIVPYNDMYYVVDMPDSTQLRFIAGFNPNTTTYNQMIISGTTFSNTCSMNSNKWNHIAWSISGTSNSPYNLGTVTICINGVNISWTGGLCAWSDNQNGPGKYLTYQTNNDFRLIKNDTSYINISSYLDNARYYNYALTIAEMQSIYNAGL